MKVYLRADENEAGVTVESIDPAHYRDAAREELTVRFTVLGKDGEKPFVKAAALLTEAESRAVVEGLNIRAEEKGDWSHVERALRRMLERDGFQPTFDWCKDVMRAFLDKKVGR